MKQTKNFSTKSDIINRINEEYPDFIEVEIDHEKFEDIPAKLLMYVKNKNGVKFPVYLAAPGYLNTSLSMEKYPHGDSYIVIGRIPRVVNWKEQLNRIISHELTHLDYPYQSAYKYRKRIPHHNPFDTLEGKMDQVGIQRYPNLVGDDETIEKLVKRHQQLTLLDDINTKPNMREPDRIENAILNSPKKPSRALTNLYWKLKGPPSAKRDLKTEIKYRKKLIKYSKKIGDDSFDDWDNSIQDLVGSDAAVIGRSSHSDLRAKSNSRTAADNETYAN